MTLYPVFESQDTAYFFPTVTKGEKLEFCTRGKHGVILKGLWQGFIRSKEIMTLVSSPRVPALYETLNKADLKGSWLFHGWRVGGGRRQASRSDGSCTSAMRPPARNEESRTFTLVATQRPLHANTRALQTFFQLNLRYISMASINTRRAFPLKLPASPSQLLINRHCAPSTAGKTFYQAQTNFGIRSQPESKTKPKQTKVSSP